MTLLVLLLTGCHSASKLTFDVWRPAKVTFPADISRVTVVNNSVDPDEQEGNSYIDWNGVTYGLLVPHDSTTYRLAEQIAVSLNNYQYFPEITIFYDDSIRLPKALYPPLTTGQLETIRGGVDNVAVVTLDDTDMRVTMTDHVFNDEMGQTIFSADLQVAVSLKLRVYWHNNATPTMEQVTDTLYWQSYGFTPDEAHAQLPPTEVFKQTAMELISYRVCRHFIPHLDQVDRYIYTSTIPALSDAWDYWQNQQYKEASYLWEYVYEGKNSREARAMAAANLAVYCELNDDYGVAIEWADKSLALFNESSYRYSGDIAHLYDYRRQLVERKNDDSLLQRQM